MNLLPELPSLSKCFLMVEQSNWPISVQESLPSSKGLFSGDGDAMYSTSSFKGNILPTQAECIVT